jgi:fructokinase
MRASFPTGDDAPRRMAEAVEWLLDQQRRVGRLHAVGVATFGPVDLDPRSSSYGHITTTPKPGWQNADLLGPLRRAFPGIPLAIDTDVNGAALGEHTWGAARQVDDFVYVTMGTGIGGGGMAGGQLLHGMIHPEMGHLRLPRVAGDEFPGACPYHGDCWEGLCSGPAILARTGVAASTLPADHPAWPLVAEYTALALANVVCILSPRQIILGGSIRKGGLLGEAEFFRAVRKRMLAALNGYIAAPALTDDGILGYLVSPQLGDDAGVCGAMALAQRALG